MLAWPPSKTCEMEASYRERELASAVLPVVQGVPRIIGKLPPAGRQDGLRLSVVRDLWESCEWTLY